MLANRLQLPPGPADERHRVRVVVGRRGRVTLQGLVRSGRRGPERLGVAEPFLLREEQDVLARHRVECFDLLQGPAEVFGFGDPLTGHLGQLGQLGLDLPVPLVGTLIFGQHVSQLGSGEGVQRLPLPAGPQQLLLISLAVHSDQVVGQIGEQGHRDRAAPGMRAGAALGRYRAAEHQGRAVVVKLTAGLVDLLGHLAVRIDLQPPLDDGPLRTRPDPGRIGPPAEEQAQAGHDHGLAGPGLSSHHSESRGQLEGRVVDNPESRDPDFLKHDRQPSPLRRPGAHQACRSAVRASPPPAGRTWRPAGP